MDELHAAPLSSASRIVSIIDVADPEPLVLRSAAVPVLTLRFDDVSAANDPTAAQAHHIQRLLAFDRDAGPDERLVVHCTAGISRSTAALAVLLARRHPELDDEIFAAIRRIRPMAWPNSRIVALGDDALARGGALTAALQRHYETQLQHPQLGAVFRAVTGYDE